MDNFKTFYNEKNGKMILFFGFYLIFFIFLGFYMRGLNNERKANETKNEPVVQEKITSYDISGLVNSDYTYNINVYDNEDTINFTGTKDNIDYANYQYKYFFDIYNVNQLLKKSKFSGSEGYVLSYELDNSELNNILLTQKNDGTNKIDVMVNAKTEVRKITMDLSNYVEKEKYTIIITYTVGDENENSPS